MEIISNLLKNCKNKLSSWNLCDPEWVNEGTSKQGNVEKDSRGRGRERQRGQENGNPKRGLLQGIFKSERSLFFLENYEVNEKF